MSTSGNEHHCGFSRSHGLYKMLVCNLISEVMVHSLSKVRQNGTRATNFDIGRDRSFTVAFWKYLSRFFSTMHLPRVHWVHGNHLFTTIRPHTHAHGRVVGVLFRYFGIFGVPGPFSRRLVKRSTITSGIRGQLGIARPSGDGMITLWCSLSSVVPVGFVFTLPCWS